MDITYASYARLVFTLAMALMVVTTVLSIGYAQEKAPCCSQSRAKSGAGGDKAMQGGAEGCAVQRTGAHRCGGKGYYCCSKECVNTLKKEPNKYLKDDKIKKTGAEWRKQLTPEQYRITRQKGTEPAFTGKYLDNKQEGTYRCVCCGQDLFDSKAKFNSGTGWPSFTAPVSDDNVTAEIDKTHGMVRSEVLCSKCQAHLGHVFDDGPAPTGLRYCINSAAVDFVEEGDKDTEQR